MRHSIQTYANVRISHWNDDLDHNGVNGNADNDNPMINGSYEC